MLEGESVCCSMYTRQVVFSTIRTEKNLSEWFYLAFFFCISSLIQGAVSKAEYFLDIPDVWTSTETVTCETLEQTNQPSGFKFVLMVACWYFLKAWCLLAYRRSTTLFCFLRLFHCNEMMHFLTEEAPYLRRFLGMTGTDAVVFLELQTDDQQVSKGLTSDFSLWLWWLCSKRKIKTLPKDSDKQPDCWAGTHKLHHVTFHWGHKWQQSNLKQLNSM